MQNTLLLRNKSTSPVRDYPLRIGRAFVQGEVNGEPEAALNSISLPTQSNVLTRWPDGSVKHAVLTFRVPVIPAISSIQVEFIDGPVQPKAETKAGDLLKNLEFNAVLYLDFANRVDSAFARDMLMSGYFETWCDGPIATTVILADHSAGRKFDIGPIRPIFHATFWHGTNDVQVRVIAENCCTETLQDVAYDVTIGMGANFTPVFSQTGITHCVGTRWSRSFWIGSKLSKSIEIDHNLAYLTQTCAIPNYDTSVKVTEATLAQTYSNWLKQPRNLFESCGWTKDQGTTGGRNDFGPVTGQQALWLYTGDKRMREIVEAQADAAGAWPLHVREGSATRLYDKARSVPAMGRAVSAYARPKMWMFDDRAVNSDQPVIHGPRIRWGKPDSHGVLPLWGGWRKSSAHEPDPYSVPYLLTGDFFYLEGLQFWASAAVVSDNPGYKGGCLGVFKDEVRGCAWTLRTRVSAAELSPNGTPEKRYFRDMLDDMLAYWEGRVGIERTPYQGTPAWNFGTKEPFRHPLHFLQDQPYSDGTGMDPTKVKTISAFWQHYFFISALGVAKERGYPTGPLLSYFGRVLLGQFEEGPDYSWFNLERYWSPSRDLAGVFYKTFASTLAAYTKQQDEILAGNAQDGYPTYAWGALSMLSASSGYNLALPFMQRMVYEPQRAGYGKGPKWAILPR